MNALLRHLALRLWVTAIIGGAVCLVLLPLWPPAIGSIWGIITALAVLGGSYGAVGWAMNRRGIAGLRRLIKEATIWERAGRAEKAHSAFFRAVAYFDSFWLSPLCRRRGEEMITGRLTRFYLSLSSPGRQGRKVIRTYLARHPEDVTVAQSWLEKLLAVRSRDPLDHELAASIARTLDYEKRIALLLVQLYISADRTDFEALQTYRQLWEEQHKLPEDLVRSLAQLLLSDAILSDWALQVYLKGYELGDYQCLTAIAECLRNLTQHPGNRRDWLAAETFVASADPMLIRNWEQPVKSVGLAGLAPKGTAATGLRPSPLKSAGRSAMRVLIRSKDSFVALVVQTRKAASAGFVAIRRFVHPHHILAVTGVVIIVVSAIIALSRPLKSPPPPPPVPVIVEQPVQEVLPKPFTIQVAAFIKTGDADHFVDQLKKQGLEAFATVAAGSNRTWHQVKISHFETRRQAQEYGEALKSRGVIDDFYVANFEP